MTPHFAHAPLGQGPVLRAIENSSVCPDRERQRVIKAAREAGIPLQIGLTQGGWREPEGSAPEGVTAHGLPAGLSQVARIRIR